MSLQKYTMFIIFYQLSKKDNKLKKEKKINDLLEYVEKGGQKKQTMNTN